MKATWNSVPDIFIYYFIDIFIEKKFIKKILYPKPFKISNISTQPIAYRKYIHSHPIISDPMHAHRNPLPVRSN